jgi:hypothetical protein
MQFPSVDLNSFNPSWQYTSVWWGGGCGYHMNWKVLGTGLWPTYQSTQPGGRTLSQRDLVLCFCLSLMWWNSLLAKVGEASDHCSGLYCCQISPFLELLCRTTSYFFSLLGHLLWSSPTQTLWQGFPKLPEPWVFPVFRPPEYLGLK